MRTRPPGRQLLARTSSYCRHRVRLDDRSVQSGALRGRQAPRRKQPIPHTQCHRSATLHARCRARSRGFEGDRSRPSRTRDRTSRHRPQRKDRRRSLRHTPPWSPGTVSSARNRACPRDRYRERQPGGAKALERKGKTAVEGSDIEHGQGLEIWQRDFLEQGIDRTSTRGENTRYKLESLMPRKRALGDEVTGLVRRGGGTQPIARRTRQDLPL